MRTTKPISTISFNTPDFLKIKLTELTDSGIISFWAFIRHQPEDDEGGKKFHCHVYMEPSKLIQTDDIKSELKEFDPSNPEHPLGCIGCTFSKWGDWYLYALHDRRYLASKGESRRFDYSYSDIVCSDPDELLYKVRSIDMSSLSPYADMIDAMRQGLSWSDYFFLHAGSIPVRQAYIYEKVWYTVSHAFTDRANRPPHVMDVDPETGEVLPLADMQN